MNCNNENTISDRTREKYGKLAGAVSIALNLLLAAGKIAAGAIFGALSVLADGFNNLTDCGSNIVSIIGFKMSGKPADKEHPFGHQRAEYVAAMFIALIILVVAVELIMQSVGKILSPAKSEFSIITLLILGSSILIKLFMFFLNRGLGKKISSEALKATAIDSLSDAVATAAVLASLLVARYSGFDPDAYAGIIVALFIGFSGVSILRDTVSRLLGKAPESGVVREMEERISRYDGVHGLHDLTVHNYGENKLYATVHVEVDAHTPITAAHDLADTIERDFAENTDVLMTVHIDPLVLDDPKVNDYREQVERAVAAIDEAFRVHDFRVVGGETYSNLIFDVAVPFSCTLTRQQLTERICEQLLPAEVPVSLVVTLERQNTV